MLPLKAYYLARKLALFQISKIIYFWIIFDATWKKLHWEVVDDMREREADEVNLLLVGALPSDDENQWNYSKSMHNNCAHRHNKQPMSHEWGKKPSILQMSCNRHYWKSRAHCRVEYEFIIHNKTIRFSYTLCIYKNSHCSVKKKVVINLNILKDKPEMLQLLGVTWAFKPGIHDIYYTEDILSFYHCYHIL